MNPSPRTLHQGRFLRLIQAGHWEYAQRTNTSMAVGIVAVTPAEELVLVTQYRIPVCCQVVEIPAGLVGDVAGHEAEGLLLAAQRELLEETGYAAAEMEVLVGAVSSAGMTDEAVTLVRATGLSKVGPGGGDASESIAVHLVPVDEVAAWVAGQQAQGAAVDVKVYAAIYFARQWLAGRSALSDTGGA